jgi:hypothetical protein
VGGAAVLIAGTKLQPPVAAVVSLSGEADPTNLVGGVQVNAGAVVGQLTVPTMVVVATSGLLSSWPSGLVLVSHLGVRDLPWTDRRNAPFLPAVS